MIKRYLCVVLLSLSFISSLYAENGWRDNEMEILVFIENGNEAQKLQSLNLMGDVYPGDAYSADVNSFLIGRMFVTPDELDKIKSLNLSYEILIENLNEHYKDFWNTHQNYFTVDQILSKMDALVSNYPDICKKTVYGKSVRGVELPALTISANVATEEYEPEAYFDGGVHGDEVGGSQNLIWFAEELCTKYGNHAYITDLLDTREVTIFVMLNPDGRDRMTRMNANGADLNRNYGYMARSKGFSEPETRAGRDCMRANQFNTQHTYHSGTICLLYPWGRVSTPTPDKNIHIALCGVYEDAAGYGTIRTLQTYNSYQTTGETCEFAYGAMGIAVNTMELSTSKQPSNPEDIYDKNNEAMLAVIEHAGYGIKGKITNAQTGEPVAAVVFIDDYYPRFSDPIVGDYHKYMTSGTYSIRVIANGYLPTTVDNVSVQNENVTEQDIELEPNSSGRSTWAYQLTFTDVGSGHTHAALGENDDKTFNLSSNNAINFDMQYSIKNIEGNDFKVHGEGSYEFLAAEDIDGPWKSLGDGSGTTEFDLSDGNLNEAQFVKIDGKCDIDAIEAMWDSPTSILTKVSQTVTSSKLAVNVMRKNVSFNIRSIAPYSLKVYNIQGKLCWMPNTTQNIEKYTWQPISTGMYVARLESGKNILTKRFTFIK